MITLKECLEALSIVEKYCRQTHRNLQDLNYKMKDMVAADNSRIIDMDLSVRTLNLFRSLDLEYVRDIRDFYTKKGKDGFFLQKGFGKKCWEELITNKIIIENEKV